MKTRTELEASLRTLRDRRPGMAALTEQGRMLPHELGMLDQAIRQLEAELAKPDRDEGAKAAQRPQGGRRAAAKGEVDYAGQRAHLEELHETTRDKLAQLAESRRAMLLDSTAAEVKAVETEQASLTADLDRIRHSLAELDRREAASEEKAAASEAKARELELDARLAELGKVGAELADTVAAAEPILDRIDALEHDVVALASRLGRRFADTDRRRPLFSRLCCGRLNVRPAAFYVSPADLVRCEERLREAPDVPAPG